MASQPPHKKQKVDQKAKLFDHLNVFVLEQGLGKTRQKIFADQLKKHGAEVSTSFNKEVVQYLIVSKDLKLERLLKLLKCKGLSESIIIVSVDWISASLVSGKLESLAKYQLFTDRNQNIELEPKKDDADKDSPTSTTRISSEPPTTTTTAAGTTPTTTTNTYKTSTTTSKTTSKTTSFEQLISLKRQIEMHSGSSCSENEAEEEKKAYEMKNEKAKKLPVRNHIFVLS